MVGGFRRGREHRDVWSSGCWLQQNQQDGYFAPLAPFILFSRSLKSESINTKICSRTLDAVTPQSRIHCLAPASSEIACLLAFRSVGARRDEDGFLDRNAGTNSQANKGVEWPPDKAGFPPISDPAKSEGGGRMCSVLG